MNPYKNNPARTPSVIDKEREQERLGKSKFSNHTMRRADQLKPHIAFIDGYWRVSPWKPGTGSLYYEAHRAIRLWNADTTRTVHGTFIKQPGVANSHYRSWDYCPYDTTPELEREQKAAEHVQSIENDWLGTGRREPKVENFAGEEPSPISGEYKPWFDRGKLLRHVANYQMGPEKLRSLMDAELEKARQRMREQHPILFLHHQNEDENED